MSSDENRRLCLPASDAPLAGPSSGAAQTGVAESVIAAWVEALGSAFVLTDAAACAPYEAATFSTTQRVVAVLRPGDAAEVVECVRIANSFRTPLYPVSRGRNWGLGSAVPVTGGNAVLDLGRLDRISGYDARLGTLTVEPGVTFRQAHAFLREQNSDFFLAPIGGPSDASVVGNIVERGDAIGPQPDRWADLSALEVVLPDGETLRSGFARFPGSPLRGLSRAAPGPLLDGLFSQSNLGVVIKATVWLTPRPACVQLLAGQIGDQSRLAPFVEALRPLVMSGVVQPGSFTIWNAYKLLARRGRYPWTATEGATPLRLARVNWFASATLYAADARIAAAQRALVGETLRPVMESIEIDDLDGNPDLAEHTEFAPGEPNDRNVRSIYWRKRGAMPAFPAPEADGCGVLWICLALPFEGHSAASALTLCEQMVLAAGFEPIIGFHSASARCLYGYVLLCYDREAAGEDGKALACHDALLDAMAARGIEPYRLGIQSMSRLADGDRVHREFLGALKRAIDPNDVLAPGRYDGRSLLP